MSSSIKSDLQLLNYKIDTINFNVEKTLNILSMKDSVQCVPSNFSIGISNPQKYHKKTDNGESIFFVSGLKIEINFEKSKQRIASGNFEITGLFSSKGFDSEETETTIVKRQIPALLFPYIRACITSTLSSAGFGTVILPLINVPNLIDKNKIEIIDNGSIQ